MIVFDSSTLVLLAKVELLDAFIFNWKGDIVIPKAVEKESIIKETFDGQLIKRRIEEMKIKVKHADHIQVEKIMGNFAINLGEAEAIILAHQEKNAALGTDDKNAINACKVLHIPFVTAIDILIIMKEKNILSKEESHIKLKGLAIYGRYTRDIIKDAFKRIGDNHATNLKYTHR